LRASCVGGHGLSVAARRPGIARIDAIRARHAVIAQYNHDIRTNPRGPNVMKVSDATPVISDRAKIER
jgi:hypothetical protein